ncbi:MAG: CotH kinase family protein, partial [Firmicutes bacterium]|nr:CotH kinase family protein [Bacillota bacterium]
AVPAEFIGYGCGSWYANPPKRNYGIKFETEQALLFMPASREWSLIACVWNNKDNSMLKCDSAYSLTRRVLKNIEYATCTLAVEVYINGHYHGVYTLSERILVEKRKINIISEQGILDTGYLLNYVWDGHTVFNPPISKFQVTGLKQAPTGIRGNKNDALYFIVESPGVGEIGTKHGATEKGYAGQVNFIKAQTQKLADALTSLDYAKLNEIADIPSFIDNLIVQELYKNFDYGSGGCYLYRKSGSPHGDGKFYAGPPWDFDWAINGYYDGWYLTEGKGTPCPFITYPYAIPEFRAAVIWRWKGISAKVKKFLNEFFNKYLDKPEYKYAFGKNFVHWDGKEKEQAASDWLTNTRNLRDWLINRAAWLDERWR